MLPNTHSIPSIGCTPTRTPCRFDVTPPISFRSPEGREQTAREACPRGVLPLDVEVIYENACLLTGERVIHRGYVGVRQGLITALGAGKSPVHLRARRRVDARNCIILPGLINCHTHVALVFARGLTQVSGRDPLYDLVWPVEAQLEPEETYHLARLGIAECLLSGTTTIVDHYFHADQVARACVELGIRAWLGYTIMQQHGPLVGEEHRQSALIFVERWSGRHPLVRPMVAPHAPDTLSERWHQDLVTIARQLGLKRHMHLAQSPVEVQRIRERGFRSPVQYAWDRGLLGDDLLAAHCIHVDAQDLDLICQSGTTVVYCPTVHASGGKVAPVAAMRERGVRVVLGSDCAAGNDDLDMWEEMRMAMASQNIARGQRLVLSPGEVLAMVTREAGVALGEGGSLGVLRTGAVADLVILDRNSVRLQPPGDQVSTVVTCTHPSEIVEVMVGGKVVVRRGRLLTGDQGEIARLGSEAAATLLSKAAARHGWLQELLSKIAVGEHRA